MMQMATLNLRLDDNMDQQLAREAELADETRSELARQAIAAFLAQRERERFLGEIARAAREHKGREGIAMAEEALATDNEALHLAEHRVTEPKARYRARTKKR
jgi:predicted transcriptional regulator